MCAPFSAFLVAHAIFAAHCVTVNVNSGSQIIAERKEALSPLIIESKLNQIVTIYVPRIKGTKAKYYLTDPRGEERKLHIKHSERKKRKRIKNNHNNTVSYNSYKTVNNIHTATDDIQVKKANTKSSTVILSELGEHRNVISKKYLKPNTDNVQEIREVNIKRNNTATISSIPKSISTRNKEKLTLYKDFTKYTLDKTVDQRLESQQEESYHTSKYNIENQREKLPNSNVQFVNLFEKSINTYAEDNQSIIPILKELKDQSLNQTEIKQVKIIKKDHADTATKKYIQIFFNEVVEVSNVSDYDDEVFRKNRKSSPNFSIGPLVEDDYGNWVLSIFYIDGSIWVELYQVITIQISENIPADPKSIRLKQGDDYILSFAYPIEQLQSCQLVSPRAASEKYYERYGLDPEYCGYIIRNVSEAEEGTWCIIGVGKIVYEANSYLQVGTGDFNFTKIERIEMF